MRSRTLAALLAAGSLTMVLAAPAGASSSPVPPIVDVVNCIVHDATTPPPQEPHTPMPCI